MRQRGKSCYNTKEVETKKNSKFDIVDHFGRMLSPTIPSPTLGSILTCCTVVSCRKAVEINLGPKKCTVRWFVICVMRSNKSVSPAALLSDHWSAQVSWRGARVEEEEKEEEKEERKKRSRRRRRGYCNQPPWGLGGYQHLKIMFRRRNKK